MSIEKIKGKAINFGKIFYGKLMPELLIVLFLTVPYALLNENIFDFYSKLQDVKEFGVNILFYSGFAFIAFLLKYLNKCKGKAYKIFNEVANGLISFYRNVCSVFLYIVVNEALSLCLYQNYNLLSLTLMFLILVVASALFEIKETDKDSKE